MTLNETLSMRVDVLEPEHVEMSMPIGPDVLQVFGYVHGGATLALIESAASVGSHGHASDDEIPFGVGVDVRHRRSAREGRLHATADLERIEPSRGVGRKLFWKVRAFDDEGNTVSDGLFVTKIVPRSYVEAPSGAGQES